MQVETRQEQHTLVVELAGDWHLAGDLPDFDAVLDGNGDVRAVAFDAERLGDWDSSLLTFLFDGLQRCRERDIAFREETLPGPIRQLVALSKAAPEREIEHDEEEHSAVARLGLWGLRALEGARETVAFHGEVAAAFGRLLTGRARIRWRDFWLTMQSNSSGALPIVSLISLLTGLIIAFLGATILERFGAGYYVSYLVSYGMLRELGALMTGIIMAGRTGAAFAAELGSMKINEELDAYRTLGISPVEYLVLPRILALFLMMPLLTVYANVVGILGGVVVAVSLLDISVARFAAGLLEPVVLADALLGLVKALAFGAIIGVAGCMRGLQTGDDASAVGKAATSAVVIAITLIVFTNAVIDWIAVLLNV